MTFQQPTARTNYAGKPSDVSEDGLPSIAVNLEHVSDVSELVALRSSVNNAIQANNVPEARLPEFLDFQKRSAARLDALKYEHVNKAETLNQRHAKKGASAPAYIAGGLHDQEGDLSRRFSLSRGVLAIAEGRNLEGAEAEATAEGLRQFPNASGRLVVPDFVRAHKATQKRSTYGLNSGSAGVDAAVNGVQTLAGEMQGALHAQPLAEQLGARVFDAVGSGSFLVPYLGRTAAASVAEGVADTSSASFNDLTLTPTRYNRSATVTALSLRTNGSNLDRLLMDDFSAAMVAAMDADAFAAVRAATTYTAATETGTDDLAATSLADLFNLVADYMTATGENAYPDLVVSPLGAKVLNTLAADGLYQTLAQAYVNQTGARIIPAVSMQDGDFSAADILANAAADTISGAGLVLAGAFDNCVIARFGGLDIVVDPYGTNADKHTISIHANMYMDSGIIRDGFRGLAVASATIAGA